MRPRTGRRVAALLVGGLAGSGPLTAAAVAADGPPAVLAASRDTVRTYRATAVGVPPAIDGRLDDDAWRGAAWTEEFVDIRGDGWPAPAWSTQAALAWSGTHLYVAARLEEPHLWATLTRRDAIIYRDHDFEVFLDPDGDGRAYYELEINALGTVFDLYLDRAYSEGGSAHIGWDVPGLKSAVALDGTLNDPSDTDRGWTVELAIPWADLRPPAGDDDVPASERARAGRAPQPGDVWRVNFSRVQWPLVVEGGGYRKAREPTRDDLHPEDNWVWSPQGVIDMHIPARWGFVTFVAGGGGAP